MYTLKNTSKRHTQRPRSLIVVLLVLLLLAGASSVWYYRHRTAQTRAQQKVASAKPGENTATSEGHTFPVPEELPKEAVKNYTLITENEQFKIRKGENSNTYIITLYPIVNNASQYSTYKDQLKEYKQSALKYLTDKGTNINTADITYEPQDANTL